MQLSINEIQTIMHLLYKTLFSFFFLIVLTAATCHVWLLKYLTPSRPLQLKYNTTQTTNELQPYHVESVQSSTLTSTPPQQQSVCILIPVTSAKQNQWSAFEDTFLYQFPLPSIASTCEPTNYTYKLLIGYDTGDRLFDNQTTLNSLHNWTSQHIPFATLTTHSIPNPRHKPGPVMNHLSKEAYTTGCDYLYRINDDTEFITPWTSAFIATLASFSPPNIGVVGPTCHEGNTAILTHDFVHRSHIDIFGSHYPPELTDWWLDDWISLVYGDERTLKLPQVVVQHHVLATRYEVTWGSMRLLKTLVEEGNKTLSDFFSNKQLRPYSNESHPYKHVTIDPCLDNCYLHTHLGQHSLSFSHEFKQRMPPNIAPLTHSIPT